MEQKKEEKMSVKTPSRSRESYAIAGVAHLVLGCLLAGLMLALPIAAAA